ncbi:DUF554 domain-containing protein [Clostridium cellulovorans]|uniref:Transport protein n=1 Tax=Clostridium cellulovorans (strain ATCC 35296 / DSM 3052 / OCM 3 / 743B) TaxID=573061 RepID=D9SRK7_CLOC7|nr:DUF554 domain-containing protein [Clostridium cellulovorans]ADL52436.1 protein of unknown function DUF554 [Clostridium cellulovorans 743B]
MLGTIINFLSILLGGIIGLLLKGKLSEKISTTIVNGLALCVLYIGISGVLKSNNTLLVVISIALGAFIGEVIDIDKRINSLGIKLEKSLKTYNQGSISEGFVTSTLLFCVGAMAIVGSLESGLKGNHSIIYTKSILDGVSSIIFASSLGIGVLISSISVLVYQGIIVLGASSLTNILSPEVVTEISAVGSLLILGLGLNMLGIVKIKVANLLPAMLIPIIYLAIF